VRFLVIALHHRSPLVLMTLIAASAALTVLLAAAPAQAASYKTCGLSQREQQPGGTKPKPTYNLSLKQRGTTCSTAKRVMRAFHACRAIASERCAKKVLAHWSCSGRRSSSASGIFYATYTCTWGKRSVKGTYQQNIPSP
jgi:hypothetical protein